MKLSYPHFIGDSVLYLNILEKVENKKSQDHSRFRE